MQGGYNLTPHEKIEGHYKCTRCKEVKPEDQFYNNKTITRGKTYWCKPCTNIQNNLIQKETKAVWAHRTYFKRKAKEPHHFLWKNAKHRAKCAGLDFTIDVSDIVIPTHCPYLGTPFNSEEKQFAPSLDRIDSHQGYVKGNVRVVSYKANRMKSNATESELIAFARGILEVHAKEGSRP